jgi:hypothetical protein
MFDLEAPWLGFIFVLAALLFQLVALIAIAGRQRFSIRTLFFAVLMAALLFAAVGAFMRAAHHM